MEQIKNRDVQKEYICKVEGQFPRWVDYFQYREYWSGSWTNEHNFICLYAYLAVKESGNKTIVIQHNTKSVFIWVMWWILVWIFEYDNQYLYMLNIQILFEYQYSDEFRIYISSVKTKDQAQGVFSGDRWALSPERLMKLMNWPMLCDQCSNNTAMQISTDEAHCCCYLYGHECYNQKLQAIADTLNPC